MRLLLFILGIGVGSVGIGTRAEAQNYPRCSVSGIGLAMSAWVTSINNTSRFPHYP
jgi:hypothetical protein